MPKKNSAISVAKNNTVAKELQQRERSEDYMLVESAKKGERTAFDLLCERYLSQLIRAAFRVTRNREDAEDAVQDALLNAFVHLRAFDGRSSFSTWLTRIAINSALMLLRKRKSLLAQA